MTKYYAYVVLGGEEGGGGGGLYDKTQAWHLIQKLRP